MDSSLSCAYENLLTNHDVIKRMKLYCLNIMRKRTIDEQLHDFSDIMNIPLELKITYKRNELEVRYAIGSENATVKGLSETQCVMECKRNFLHNLRVLCRYTVVPRSPVPENEMVNCKPNDDRQVYVNVTNEPQLSAVIDLADSSETVAAVPSNDEAKTAVNDNDQTSSKNTVRNESHHSSIVWVKQDPEDSKIMTETNDELTTTVGVKMNIDVLDADENDVVRNEPFGDDRQCSSISSAPDDVCDKPLKVSVTSQTRSRGSRNVAFDELEEHEMLVARASDVLNRVTENTLCENADALLDVLVRADRAAESYMGLVTDVIVKMAIKHPDIGGLYASLCSKTVVKASADPRFTTVADEFVDQVKMSCNSVLSELPRNGDPTTVKVRGRTLETCKFMGRLFMAKNLKMSHVIKRTVNHLVESCDAHRLECLCGLLRIIGPRFEMVDRVSRRCSAAQVYERLERHAVYGTLPPRTVRKIGRLVLERNRNWLLPDGRATRKPDDDDDEVNVPKKFVGLWESS